MGDIKSVEKVLVGEWVISNESKIKLDFHGDRSLDDSIWSPSEI